MPSETIDLTEKDKQYILKNWDKQSYTKIAEKLNKSCGKIKYFIEKKGFRKKKTPKQKINLENLLIKKFPEIAKEWNDEKNGNRTPDNTTYGSNYKAWWNCELGHQSYQARVHHRTISHSGCPECAKQYKTSYPEQAIYFYIKKGFSDALSTKVFEEIKYYEADIFIPSLNFIIEYDGARYHKTREKDEDKNKLFKKAGYQVLRVREFGLPDIKKHGAFFIFRENIKSDESLNQSILSIFDFVLKKYKNRLETETKNKIKSIMGSVDSSKDRAKIFKALKIKQVKNSLAACFPDLLEDWNEPDIDPKTISKGAETEINWKCRTCQYEWKAVVKSRTGPMKAGCPRCSKNERYTYEQVKEAFKKKGYRLTSKEYINARTYLSFICKKHPELGEQKVRYGVFNTRSQNCKKCASEKQAKIHTKYTIELIRAEFKKRNFNLVSKTYPGIMENLEFICLKHKETGVQTVSYNNFKHIVTPCKTCANENRTKKTKEKSNQKIFSKAKELGAENVKFIDDKQDILEFVCKMHKSLGKQTIERKKTFTNKFFCKTCANDSKKIKNT